MKISGEDYRNADWDRLPLSWVIIGAVAMFALLLFAGSHDKIVREACQFVDDSCQPRQPAKQECKSTGGTWESGQCWDQSLRRKGATR